jgi:uncharacterized protein YgbK (DUF1537 family)
MILGCIADDFTGATDLANNLVRAGMRVVQTIGVPATPAEAAGLGDVDAVVVALKSRTAPVDEAVAQSLPGQLMDMEDENRPQERGDVYRFGYR